MKIGGEIMMVVYYFTRNTRAMALPFSLPAGPKITPRSQLFSFFVVVVVQEEEAELNVSMVRAI